MAMTWRSRIFPIVLPVLCLLVFPLTTEVLGQAWPAKTIVVVNPFGAGGTGDVLARGYAQAMTRELGQNVIVENRAGAGGNIGSAAVARAAPDGHNLLFASTGPIATNKLMYKTMPFDPDKELQPVILTGKIPVVIAARKGGKFTDITTLIEYARANPGKVNFGVPGNGTVGHLVALLFGRNLGISLTIVQYNSSSQIINDVLGGHLDIAVDTVGAYVPQVNDGQIEALALTSLSRSPVLPKTPTLAEAANLPGFEVTGWYGVLVPVGTPPAIIARLNTAANAYLKSDEGKDLYSRLSVDTAGGTPEEFKAFIAAETEKMRPVVREAGITF